MINFIEVNSGTERCVVNTHQIYKIVPVIGGTGCVFHFDNGKTQNVSDSYETIKTVLIGNSKSSVLTEEVKVSSKKTTKD